MERHGTSESRSQGQGESVLGADEHPDAGLGRAAAARTQGQAARGSQSNSGLLCVVGSMKEQGAGRKTNRKSPLANRVLF